MRHAMGVAVFFGMLGVTLFGLFLTPVFYVLLRYLTGNRPLKQHGEGSHIEEIFAEALSAKPVGGEAPVHRSAVAREPSLTP
jgi:multidrug efflux pump